jgi:hypothetical protein
LGFVSFSLKYLFFFLAVSGDTAPHLKKVGGFAPHKPRFFRHRLFYRYFILTAVVTAVPPLLPLFYLDGGCHRRSPFFRVFYNPKKGGLWGEAPTLYKMWCGGDSHRQYKLAEKMSSLVKYKKQYIKSTL